MTLPHKATLLRIKPADALRWPVFVFGESIPAFTKGACLAIIEQMFYIANN